MNPSVMNPEVKKEWVAALRSGKYDQGMGSLKLEVSDTQLYCCLGVLCELAVEAGVIPPGERHEDQPKNYSYYFLGEDEFLPSEVMTWANLDTNNGIYKPADNVWGYDQALTDLNDNGKSFNELADIIENNF